MRKKFLGFLKFAIALTKIKRTYRGREPQRRQKQPQKQTTVGFSHCNRFSNRIYDFGGQAGAIDPTLNRTYAAQLQSECPRNVDPSVAIELDPITPRTFDNQYFRNLQLRMGLLTSDQTLAEDGISRPTVNTWAANSAAFSRAFVTAMTNLGQVGVKTRAPLGNIRRDCSVLN
ncbi:Peroxidase 35 [Platanthera guangdongensis]|uniref:Peroxidase 35 n=1 Tax=Platanthera guangdongensis TaxID=2320717 RepID=A0ABR2M265_9ASPA